MKNSLFVYQNGDTECFVRHFKQDIPEECIFPGNFTDGTWKPLLYLRRANLHIIWDMIYSLYILLITEIFTSVIIKLD